MESAPSQPAPGEPGPDDDPAGLAAALTRAVDAGIISADQADAVLAAEQDRPQPGRPGPERPQGRGLPRRRPVAEALGYLGGLLAISGAVTLVVQYWRDVPIAGRLALLAAVAIATWVVGEWISDRAAPALVRLRGALWFASSVAVAALVGQFVWDVAHGSEETVVLSSGAAGAIHAALLWRGADRPAQHLAALVGVLTAVGGAAALAVTDAQGVVGLSVAVVAALWVVGGWLRLLPPPLFALVGGGVAVLVALAITAGDWSDAAPLLGLAATAVFVAVGVGTDRTPLTVVGLLGAFGYLPWTVGHFFADSLGVPLAMLLCGVALLAVTLLLLRTPLRDLPAR